MPKITGLSHVAIHAKDPKSLAEFYNDLLGLEVVGTKLIARGIEIRATPIQAGSIAIFFPDPEDNLVEVLWPTSLADRKLPFIYAVNLESSEEEIMGILQN